MRMIDNSIYDECLYCYILFFLKKRDFQFVIVNLFVEINDTISYSPFQNFHVWTIWS